jgi:hypothetical protein
MFCSEAARTLPTSVYRAKGIIHRTDFPDPLVLLPELYGIAIRKSRLSLTALRKIPDIGKSRPETATSFAQLRREFRISKGSPRLELSVSDKLTAKFVEEWKRRPRRRSRWTNASLPSIANATAFAARTSRCPPAGHAGLHGTPPHVGAALPRRPASAGLFFGAGAKTKTVAWHSQKGLATFTLLPISL